jgi:uncharacterized protein YggE
MIKLKVFSISLLFVFTGNFSYAQVSGNVHYSDKNNYNRNDKGEILPVAQFEKDNTIIIEANTLFNVPADHFVAIFNVNQLGETAASANEMLDSRLKGIKEGFIQAGIKEKDIFVDMLTFVPEYEYEVTKKVFSKTYNEIPKGFRIQKNIHVRYSSSKKLDQLISICAKYEVYDLVKVEYYSENSKVYFDSLRMAAKEVLKSRLKDYKDLGIVTDGSNAQITESTFVSYPVENYNSYQAYNSSSLDAVKKSSTITNVEKYTSLYYNPITEKGYDVVYNPVITEPVIQYALSMRMRLVLKEPKTEVKTEYYMLSPNGTLIPIKK